VRCSEQDAHKGRSYYGRGGVGTRYGATIT
jgi:hypothetical protein